MHRHRNHHHEHDAPTRNEHIINDNPADDVRHHDKHRRTDHDDGNANLNLVAAVNNWTNHDQSEYVLVRRDDFDFLVDAINNGRSNVYLANCARALVINHHDAAAAVLAPDDTNNQPDDGALWRLLLNVIDCLAIGGATGNLPALRTAIATRYG